MLNYDHNGFDLSSKENEFHLRKIMTALPSPKGVFNIYLDGRIEHISLINIRPLQNNRTLEVEDPVIKEKMNVIIKRLVI